MANPRRPISPLSLSAGTARVENALDVTEFPALLLGGRHWRIGRR